jgi:hypothetical protein
VRNRIVDNHAFGEFNRVSVSVIGKLGEFNAW